MAQLKEWLDSKDGSTNGWTKRGIDLMARLEGWLDLKARRMAQVDGSAQRLEKWLNS
jgi:hypothetical protein